MENSARKAEPNEGKIISMSKGKASKDPLKEKKSDKKKDYSALQEKGQATLVETGDMQKEGSTVQYAKVDPEQIKSIISTVVQQIKSEIKPEIKSVVAVNVLPVVLTTAFIMIGGIFAGFCFAYNELSDTKSNIAVLQNDVSKLITDVSELDTEVDNISKYLHEKDGVEDQLEEIHNMLNTSPIVTTANVPSSIDDLSIEKNDVNTTAASLSPDTCLGNDSDGKEYIAKDFVGQTVFLTYNEGNSEVFFRGQYNENYHWDGYCVTNVYDSNGFLTGICESNFENGKRLDYKSFYPSGTGGQWIYTDRICSGTVNKGISIRYGFSYEKPKKFTSSNARITDFLYVDKFIDSNPVKILSYYSGETSEGTFNDMTGDAYEVLYYEDGTIKTLYKGQFVGGDFEDSTGNAWDIAYSDEWNAYFYNTGKFENRSAVKQSDKPISMEEIQNIIDQYDFDCELKWRQ